MKELKRIKIIVGHYGSGKSEFSVHYALSLKERYPNVALADIDIINLYFRSREARDYMEERGVHVIGSYVDTPAVDTPSISAEIFMPIENEDWQLVLDVGGGSRGSTNLQMMRERLDGKYELIYVLNANRPETQTLEQNFEMIKVLEAASGLIMTGIINNTHLLKDTCVEDVMKGYQVASELSEGTGLPLIYNVALRDVAEQLPKDLKGEIFPIDLVLRQEWMA